MSSENERTRRKKKKPTFHHRHNSTDIRIRARSPHSSQSYRTVRSIPLLWKRLIGTTLMCTGWHNLSYELLSGLVSVQSSTRYRKKCGQLDIHQTCHIGFTSFQSVTRSRSIELHPPPTTRTHLSH